MTFLYPLGLLGLLAIPVIILIYILQSKYTEQTVPSNYLWHLSEKFLKRKNPFSGLSGIISLILQILTVVAISLAVARPIFILPGAANDYCFVLDASGSMHTMEGKHSRYELAQEEIEDVIRASADGSSYTLIAVSDEAVTVFEGVRDKKTAISLVQSTTPTHKTTTHATLLSTAQRAFDANRASLIYLVSDKGYNTHANVNVIDVGSEDVANLAVFEATHTQGGGRLLVDATVLSFTTDADVTVELFVDDTLADTKTINVAKNGEAVVSFDVPCTHFRSWRVQIATADAYTPDNAITTYNLKSDKTYSTLIISDTGFFFEAVIDALVDSTVETVTPEQYEKVTEQYGLYIFDNCQPDTLPDGAVWLINADRSITDAGFGVRGKISLGLPDVIEKSKSTATAVRHLLRGVDGKDIYISNYVKYSGMYLNFATLFSYDSNPLIFAGTNGLGNRQVVFGFDLHESDFALSTDFVILLRNLLEYSFPNVIEETNYTVGEEAIINILPNAAELKAVSPSGADIYMESDGATATILLDEVGTYTVSHVLGGEEHTYSIWAGAHPDESRPATNEDDFSLSGEQIHANIDGTYNPLTLILICLAILFLADWGVYCYEKYQLR